MWNSHSFTNVFIVHGVQIPLSIQLIVDIYDEYLYTEPQTNRMDANSCFKMGSCKHFMAGITILSLSSAAKIYFIRKRCIAGDSSYKMIK